MRKDAAKQRIVLRFICDDCGKEMTKAYSNSDLLITYTVYNKKKSTKSFYENEKEIIKENCFICERCRYIRESNIELGKGKKVSKKKLLKPTKLPKYIAKEI